MAAPQLPTRGKWTTGIFDCFEDCSNCWVTCVCPCLTFARNAEIVDEGKTTAFTAGRNCLVLCNFVPVLGATLYGCTYRSKLRRRFELPEQPCKHCGDCCVHHLCCFCALCQEHRELTNRQMDPRGGLSLGKSAERALGTCNPCHQQYTSNSHLFSYRVDYGGSATVNSIAMVSILNFVGLPTMMCLTLPRLSYMYIGILRKSLFFPTHFPP